MVQNIYDEIAHYVSKSNLSVIGVGTSTQSQIIMHEILYKFQIIDLGEIDTNNPPSILSEIRESRISQIFDDVKRNIPPINYPSQSEIKKVIVFKLKKLDDKKFTNKLKEESLKYNIPILIFVDTYQSSNDIKLVGGDFLIYTSDFCMVIDNRSKSGISIIKNRIN